MLEFTVNDNKLTFKGLAYGEVPSGGVNYPVMSFEFSNDWSEITTPTLYIKRGEVEDHVDIVNGITRMPTAFLNDDDLHESIYIGVIGEKYADDVLAYRIVTNLLALDMQHGAEQAE